MIRRFSDLFLQLNLYLLDNKIWVRSLLACHLLSAFYIWFSLFSPIFPPFEAMKLLYKGTVLSCHSVFHVPKKFVRAVCFMHCWFVGVLKLIASIQHFLWPGSYIFLFYLYDVCVFFCYQALEVDIFFLHCLFHSMFMVLKCRFDIGTTCCEGRSKFKCHLNCMSHSLCWMLPICEADSTYSEYYEYHC